MELGTRLAQTASGVIPLLLVSLVSLFIGCGTPEQRQTDPLPPPPLSELVSIVAEPNLQSTLTIPTTFTVTGYFSDGTSADVTAQSVWTSASPGVITWTGSTANLIGGGTSFVTVTVGTFTESGTLTVN